MNEERKTERKRKRFAQRLKNSKGVVCCDVPTANIVLCNAGQATGLEKECICKLIRNTSLEIEFPKYIAEKGETYSFLVFKNTENALQFYNRYNGKAKVAENETPLYMNFVENVPNCEIICQHSKPKDLQILNDFITHEEEQYFIKIYDWSTEIESKLKNRQVRHYGYEFRYGTNDVDLDNPLAEKIPNECDVLWTRLKELGLDLGIPDQLTINKYAPGQGIPSHVDKHSPFKDTILSLSLGSQVVMDWKHHSGKYVPIVLPERSLMIMQGEARYDWQHGIQPRTWDPVIETRTIADNNNHKKVQVITSETVLRNTRISLTFRWTKSGPCQCAYRTLCDSVIKDTEDIQDEVATALEELHVHQVYETIAGHFSTTRHKPWPRVLRFLSRARPGHLLLDLGAGNGKNLQNRHDIMQIAGERSSGLLSECKVSARQAGAADCVRLDLLHPGLRNGCADIIICIAVIHHFSTKSRRLQAISTISRLLCSGGSALITVWAKDQTKSNYLCKDKSQETTNQVHSVGDLSLPVHENRTQFQHNDLLVPWKLRKLEKKKLANEPENTLLRYYHVFEENELAELCREVPGLEVESSVYDEGNWCVVCRKI